MPTAAPIPILAQSGLSFLIYLVIGIFWVVGNLLQQKEAKRKAEALRKRREEEEEEARRTGKPVPSERKKSRSLEDDLETFLGRLAGEPVSASEQKPAPPPPPRPKPRTTPPPLRPKIEFDGGRGPQPMRRAIQDTEIKVGDKIQRESSIDDLVMSRGYKEIEDLKEIRDISSEMLRKDVGREALESARSMMVDLSPSTLELITIPTQSVRPVKTRTSRPNLNRARNVRRALVNSIILDQPKALQEEPFKETP